MNVCLDNEPNPYLNPNPCIGRAIDEKSSHIKQTFDGKQATLIILKVFTDDEGKIVVSTLEKAG